MVFACQSHLHRSAYSRIIPESSLALLDDSAVRRDCGANRPIGLKSYQGCSSFVISISSGNTYNEGCTVQRTNQIRLPSRRFVNDGCRSLSASIIIWCLSAKGFLPPQRSPASLGVRYRLAPSSRCVTKEAAPYSIITVITLSREAESVTNSKGAGSPAGQYTIPTDPYRNTTI